jgi:hypothetical protein
VDDLDEKCHRRSIAEINRSHSPFCRSRFDANRSDRA